MKPSVCDLLRTAVDCLNVVFVLAITIATLARCVGQPHSTENKSKNKFLAIVSICCILSGVGYFVFGIWVFFKRHNLCNLVLELIRGVAWLVLAVSLNCHKTKSEKMLILTWSLSFSIFVSALNIKDLVLQKPLQIIDIASWPVNFLLLLLSFVLIKHFNQEEDVPNQDLSEPLLHNKSSKTELPTKPFFLNHLVFAWINPLLRLGRSRPLNLQDIPPLEQEDAAHVAYEIFAKEFDLVRRRIPNSTNNLVLRALAKCYMKQMILAGLLALLRGVAVVAAPLLLYAFVNCSGHDGKQDLGEGLMLVVCLIVVKLVESFSQRHWFFIARRCGMRMRSALMAAVYQKLLKLSSNGKQCHSAGEIVNYIAVDAYRLGEFPLWFHTAWALPLQLATAVALLFATVGSGALPGLVLLLICGLLNFPFAKALQNCQALFMAAQDERLRATSEVLNNMKIIKLQSWEEKFKNLIFCLREKEFKWLKQTQVMKSYGTALYWLSPLLVSSIVFAGCSVLGSAPLNASTIFTILATLRVMSEPVRSLPEALSILIQVKVSMDRLDLFLLESELNKEDVDRASLRNSQLSVGINMGCYSWDLQAASPTLKNIVMEATKGQKVAVCGPVGSGKSSLLCALLGEIPKISGSISVNGSIAYVAQTAWIQSGTILDNILYGKPMDRARYEKTIKVCALDMDLDHFDRGDLTEIGQRGLNMSGGQKQRIQLARAVYSDADIYLLDDPFSAVDAHTASFLFNECVMGALGTKTVILVTHQTEFLAQVDNILVMEDGLVAQMGRYGGLLQSGTLFESLALAHQEAVAAINPCREEDHLQHKKGDHGHEGLLTVKFENSEEEFLAMDISATQLTEDEQIEKDIGWTPYIDYIHVTKAYLHLSLLFLHQLIFLVLQTASSYWLALAVQWPKVGSGIMIGVYAGLSTVSVIFVYLRTLAGVLHGLAASKAFFSGFMDSVFKAPMLFFDSTPVGRILTRASSDMSVIDYDMPYAIVFALTGFLELLLTTMIMAVVTWQLIVVAIPVLLFAGHVQGYYLSTARALIRINGTTKAPVMNCASETSLGVATIRAFKMTKTSVNNYLHHVDTDASLFFYSNAALEWVILRVEALQNIVIVTAALFLVLAPKASISPGFVGLSVSYALSLTSTQSFLTRFYSTLSNYVISAERIKQYMYIPPEPAAVVDDKRPPSSWPSQGRIDVQDLKIRYSPNAPLVLKGITCTFKAGERVGIVGRTGSGKTTLISALFRLVDPASGRIIIDGVDIHAIGLKDLRMKISIIPQEPALFRGTLRSNLDPLGLYSDDDIWEVLRKCQLSSVVRSLPQLLGSSVSDEGQNWSVGQRQLVCLGRVLLRRNKILVLDEATASIDSATDAVLQTVIRQEFKGCTVITVAHRVPTVTDSDLVMVLSYGKLIECDKPSELMGTNSSFAKLVAEYWADSERSSMQDI